MHISGIFQAAPKADVEEEKADIGTEKADIETIKADIHSKISNLETTVSDKTVSHIKALYEACGEEKIFGRAVVETVTGLKSTRASELIKFLLNHDIIEAVQGHGKGKYRFK